MPPDLPASESDRLFPSLMFCLAHIKAQKQYRLSQCHQEPSWHTQPRPRKDCRLSDTLYL